MSLPRAIIVEPHWNPGSQVHAEAPTIASVIVAKNEDFIVSDEVQKKSDIMWSYRLANKRCCVRPI
jgi:hypothetical protein